jgi:hypothetical protein
MPDVYLHQRHNNPLPALGLTMVERFAGAALTVPEDILLLLEDRVAGQEGGKPTFVRPVRGGKAQGRETILRPEC